MRQVFICIIELINKVNEFLQDDRVFFVEVPCEKSTLYLKVEEVINEVNDELPNILNTGQFSNEDIMGYTMINPMSFGYLSQGDRLSKSIYEFRDLLLNNGVVLDRPYTYIDSLRTSVDSSEDKLYTMFSLVSTVELTELIETKKKYDELIVRLKQVHLE